MACKPAAEKDVYLQILRSLVLHANVGVQQQPFRKALLSKRSAHQSGQVKQKPTCAVVQRAIAEGHHIPACGDGDQQFLLDAPTERPQGQAPLTRKVCLYAGWPLYPCSGSSKWSACNIHAKDRHSAVCTGVVPHQEHL